VGPFFHAVSDRRPVTGLWADNWLGPRSNVHLSEIPSERDFYIGGIPSVDMTLTIKLNGKTQRKFELTANEYKTIRFSINPEAGRLVQLRFSGCSIDSALRPLSFHLMDTDLFREQDTL